ncbi:MAG: hypothetical protein HPZ91_08145 [Lentisphaeria bacterium]|nr:hypothetical protein [Lentisphaeria bacterium]
MKSVREELWKNRRENSIDELLPEEFYLRIAGGKANRRFFPEFSDRSAWRQVAGSGWKADEARRIVAEADGILTRPMEALSAYDYFRFVLDGNRACFERRYFRRRNELGTLVLALCFSGELEKYLPAVIDRLGAIAAEPYWCMHAHAKCDGDPMPVFSTARQVDLFAAETAQQTALTLQILHDELKACSPRFLRFCKEKVLEKTVLPVLEHFFDTSVHYWTAPGEANNWTPWCAGNILQAGAILLDDPELLAELTRKLNCSASIFFSGYADDGYCDEGPGYWNKAAVRLFCHIRTLDAMVPGSAAALFRSPRLRAMGEFGAEAVIVGRDHVISADCGHAADDGFDNIGTVYDFGCRIDSGALKSFALNRRDPMPRRRPAAPEEAENVRLGTGDKLSGALDSFFHLPDDPGKEANVPLPAHSIWSGRLGIVRHPGGFSGALKAGNNQESHNHNDLGHFTLYYRDTPLVIDLGTGGYSRQNFSADRYRLFYTGAQGHNAPLFGGAGQQAGREYSAGLEYREPDTLVCDLARAYPEESGVTGFCRTLVCGEEQATLRDSFELVSPRESVVTLYSPCEVRILEGGELDFGGAARCRPEGIACSAVEELPAADVPRHWGARLWKITLMSAENHYRLTFIPA